jgi:hypothetical protein
VARSFDDLFAEREAVRTTSLSDVFSEEPVRLEVFVSDKKFLAQPKLSEIQYAALRNIERVYMPDLYPRMAEAFDPYWGEIRRLTNLITLQWGKGSGKDHICRLASLRIAYLLMCLKSPQSYFGTPEQDSIHMLNIASSASQADTAFFRPMIRAVNNSPWFRDKAEPKQGFIAYDKNIEAISGHSDSETQEGGNLILAVLDEIDAFKTKEELSRHNPKAVRDSPRSAESILKMTRTSSTTRFPVVYKNVRISYPRYQGSTIQKLTAEGQRDVDAYGDTSRHFVSGPFATWEVNPLRKKEDFDTEFREDPVMSKAMYMCQPSRATDAYFRNMPAIRSCVIEGEQPITVEYKLRTLRSDLTGNLVQTWQAEFTIAPWFKPIAGAQYAMHGDLALRGDRAGISMSHIKRWEDRPETVTLDDGSEIQEYNSVPIVENDFVLALESKLNETPSREIQIRWARELAYELYKLGFHIAMFSFDGFQSADSMQILNQRGIETKKISADVNDDVWKALRDVGYDDRLVLKFNQLLFDELEALSKIPGGKVDHPPSGSKDLADALACSILGAIEVGGQEDPTGEAFSSGEKIFEVGDALSMPDGFDDWSMASSDHLGLPVGMKGSGFGGY